jgi:hypothetical protein
MVVPKNSNAGEGLIWGLVFTFLIVAALYVAYNYESLFGGGSVSGPTTTPSETINKAQESTKETLERYGLPADTVKTDPPPSKESFLDKAESIAKDTLTDPKFYEAVAISEILKKAMTGALEKGLLQGGEVAAKAIAKALEEVGVKAAAEIAEKVGAKLGEMAAGVAAGPPGWLFDIIQGLSLGLDLWDPAGFNQFASNKSMILPIRDKIEKAAIQAKQQYNLQPPYVFSLGNTVYSPTLKPISSVFSDALQNYQNSLMSKAINNLPKDKYDTFLDDIKNKIDVSTDEALIKAIVDQAQIEVNKDPKARDKYLFDYINLKIDGKLKQYIVLNDSVSSTQTIGVTLSEKGADLFNQETLNNADVAFLALYSKYYRTLDSNGNLTAKTLASPVTQQSYLKTVMNMCTGTSLTSKMELIKQLPRADVNPSQYGVTFNNDTGICNYTKNYCERFGMMKSSGSVDGIKYTDCKNLPGEEIASLVFGTTLTHAVVFMDEKEIDLIETGYKTTKDQAVKAYGSVEGFFSDTANDVAKGIVSATSTIDDATTSAARQTWKTLKSTASAAADEARKAKEEAQRLAEEAARKAKEEAERLAEETKKKAEEAARKTKEEAERLAEETKKKTQEAARKAKEEAERLAEETKKKTEEAARKAKEEADRLARESKKGYESAKKTLKKWFSDDRLKTNITRVHNRAYGKFLLPVYTWDWIPNNPFGLVGSEHGVMSSDVAMFCPDAVSQYHGYDIVDYNLIR